VGYVGFPVPMLVRVAGVHRDDLPGADRYRLAGLGLLQPGKGPDAAARGVLELLYDFGERGVDHELVARGEEELRRGQTRDDCDSIIPVAGNLYQRVPIAGCATPPAPFVVSIPGGG
jgi:hypothetical protein